MYLREENMSSIIVHLVFFFPPFISSIFKDIIVHSGRAEIEVLEVNQYIVGMYGKQ